MSFLKRSDGYTLIEVMVATAIFLIAVLAISGLLMQGYRAMGFAGRRSVTLHLTQEEMEAAITSADYYSESDDVEIIRQDHEVTVFGKKVGGTLIIVNRSHSGQTEGAVSYTYFVPDGIGGGP